MAPQTVQEHVSLAFCPDDTQRQHMPCFDANSNPTYLYRLVAPHSAGTTNTSTVVTPAAVSGQAEDIFHLTNEKGARRLLGHLLWQRGHEQECNLTSWTSSLLFALQYALYRHRKDNDPLSNILLVVLDTRDFPADTFVKDMEIMNAFRGIDHGLDKFIEFRESPYYFGEYLTQGRLDVEGRCVSTSMQSLIDGGLFQLQPALGDETQWKWWPKRVLEFRADFDASKTVPTTEDNVATAIELGECFGADWTVPGALMFLALQPRKSNDQAIIQGFKTQFAVEEIQSLSLEAVQVDDDRLPEVAEFKKLIDMVHDHCSKSEVDVLLSSVGKLEI